MLQDAVLSLAHIKVGINCASNYPFEQGRLLQGLVWCLSVPCASVTFSHEVVRTHVLYILHVVCELVVSLQTAFFIFSLKVLYSC